MQGFINTEAKNNRLRHLSCEERTRSYLLQESLKNQHANRGHILVTTQL